MPTTTFVSRLIRLNPDQWSSASFYGKDLTAQRLGRILNNAFGINSVRSGDSARARGYNEKQFEIVWRQLGLSLLEPTESDEPDGDGYFP